MTFWMLFFRFLVENGSQNGSHSKCRVPPGSTQRCSKNAPKTHPRQNLDFSPIWDRFGEPFSRYVDPFIDFGNHFSDIYMVLLITQSVTAAPQDFWPFQVRRFVVDFGLGLWPIQCATLAGTGHSGVWNLTSSSVWHWRHMIECNGDESV